MLINERFQWKDEVILLKNNKFNYYGKCSWNVFGVDIKLNRVNEGDGKILLLR
jgi:hypothetical protein